MRHRPQREKEGYHVTSFQKVYEEYAQPVYRYLLILTGSGDWAEELLSETFYQALRYIDRFEGRCSIYAWLCQIGKNAWIKECKRRKRYSEIPVEELVIPDGRASQEEQAITKELYCAALKALQGLADPYRDVFILHAIGRVKLKEIAGVYGKSESWARVTYFRAKQQLIQEVSK